MYYIYIDGDNICLERYIADIHKQILNITGSDEFEINVICQSNILFKYTSERNFDLRLKCCKTKNKNATDARIIFHAGVHRAKNEKVIIVSNDKIYEEITEQHWIIVIGFPLSSSPKIVKLKKRNVINAIERIRSEKGTCFDITVSDLQDYFPTFSLLDIRRYIESLQGVHISAAEAIYVRS